MKLKIARFRKFVEVKPQGSVTLGFADVVLQQNADVEVNDVVVRITVDGRATLDLPRRRYLRNGEEKSAPIVRISDPSVFAECVKHAFAHPGVKDAVREARAIQRELAEKKEAELELDLGGNTESDDEIPF